MSAITYGGTISGLLLPTPSAVATAGWQVIVHGYQGVGFWLNVGVSMRRVAIGWGSAVIVGTLLGLGIGLSSVMRTIFDPLIEFYRPIPPLGYLSLLIVWFGIGEVSKNVVLFLAALPPMVLNTADAVKAVRADRVDGVRTLGGSKYDVLRFVVLPSCLPVITGARVAFSNTFTTLVAAENTGREFWPRLAVDRGEPLPQHAGCHLRDRRYGGDRDALRPDPADASASAVPMARPCVRRGA